MPVSPSLPEYVRPRGCLHTLTPARRAVVEVIKRNGGQTVEQLAEYLGVSPSAIRQHLQYLIGEGLVDFREALPHGRGRPKRLYELTEVGEELFPRHSGSIALRLLATVVAFIGILSALMALQLEHTREYGVMRATGMTPIQLRGYTFIQTGLMGLVAGILAIPIGIVLAMVLVYVINVRSFGWTMQFTIIPGEVAQAFAAAIGAALLAGVYPAIELARMNISRAVRSE